MPSTDSKWKIPSVILINADASAVWDLISSPGFLKKVHPFLKDNICEEWSGVGSSDIVHYQSGRKLKRTITAWIEGEGLNIQAVPLIEDGSGSKATIEIEWRIKPLGENHSELSTSLYPHRMKGRSGLKAHLFFHLKMKPMWVKYWKTLLKGVKHHIETGETVTENQFGAHSFFSAQTS
ncbi:MAG: hypothetical protein AAF212_09200 [Verrucomicrobiota bacterium]